MSQELANIVIVEDDDYMYGKMLPFLNIAGTTIERTMSWNGAMRLLKQSNNRIFWIVDGNFPKFDNEKKIERMGPELIERIQQYRIGNMGIVGFTSEPGIFQKAGTNVPIFDKQYFSSSMGKIVEHILRAQKS